MKKHISTIMTVLALGIAVVSQFRISGLESEIQQMENRLSNSISMMQSDQSAAISHMQEMMEKEASIITYTDFSLGEMNLTNKSFVLNGSVTPKEHQPGLTEAFLTVNETAYPMELTNGSYTVQVSLPLFEEVKVSKVEFHEGDIVRTETLTEQWSPRYELLPQVHGRLSGSGRGSASNGIYTWHREGEIRVSIEGKGQNIDEYFVSIIEELDGVEVGRTEIPLTGTEGNQTFNHTIDRDFNIPFGSTLELLAEVVDSNGLHYRVVLEHWSVNEKGENIEDDLFGVRDLFEKISDADGNILYETNEDDYK